MSGIAGCLHCSGKPVDANLVRQMVQAIAHRGPYGEGHWIHGPVGLGHCLLHTTPESLHEVQPFASEDESLVIVCDARIDNRKELAATLATHGILLRTVTDAELILKAYARWGAACPQHLLGDFAFALWDHQHRRLFCARDPIGVKPFYYHWDGDRFLFASEIKALLEVPGMAKRMNDAMIADYFLWDFRHPDATFFDGIMQLRPAHALTLERGTLRLGRYWDATLSAQISYQRDDEYLEHFRELFSEAVRCRLRSQFPVGVMLSGGIDSTLVTAMAETLRQEDPAWPPLTAFTLLYDDVHPEDREVIQRLVQKFGTEAQLIQPGTDQAPTDQCPSETPGDAFLAHRAALEAVRAKGCRVLLTGFGADELVGTSEDGILKDLLRGFRFASLAREIRRMAGAGWTTGGSILLDLLRDQVPPRLRWLIKVLLGRQVPSWIEPGLAKRLGLAWRIPSPERLEFPTMCQEESFKALTTPVMTLDLNHFDGAASDAMVEWRHPFLDRRLIEFFLSVPSRVKMRAGQRKGFAQLALRDIAPGPIRHQEGETPVIPPQDGRMSRALEVRQIEQLLGPANGPLFRYVRASEMARLMSNYVDGNLSIRTPLWKMRDLQRWVQTHFPEEMPRGNREGLAVEGHGVSMAGITTASPTGGGT